MPRTTQEVLEHAAELVRRFELSESDDLRDATALRALREAFVGLATAQRQVVDAVIQARRQGHSWAAIGTMVGTSGEAARQRFGNVVNASP